MQKETKNNYTKGGQNGVKRIPFGTGRSCRSLLFAVDYFLSLSFAYRFLLITVLYCLPLTTYHLPLVYGSFEDMGTGARPTGLGGAFVSVADDVHSLYYNPAGISYLRKKEISATYGILHSGFSDKSKINNSYIAYGHPLKEEIGTIGLAYHQFSLEGLYTERLVGLGYGRRFSQKWALGMNFKHLYREFTAPSGQTSNDAVVETSKLDPVFATGNSKSNVGFDMGMLFRPYRNYSYGLMFQNLNQPNMAISDNDKDSVPMNIRIGMAYNERTLMITGEVNTKRSLGTDRDYYMTTAAEKWWLGAGFSQADLAVRGSLAFGSRSFSQMTIGLTYRLSSLQVDYGLLMPLGGITFSNSQGSHRISLTMRFGRILVEPDYEQRMRSAEEKAKKAEGELDQALKEAEKLNQELEKLKTESEKRKEEIQATRQRAGVEAAAKQSSARYAEAMEKYWNRKASGANLEERVGILSQIMKEFSGSGANLSQAEKELSVAKSDRAKSEVDLAISWSYYQKIVARGASVPERIELLSRMIERFARTGIDLTNVRDEMRSLRGQR